MTTRNIFGIDQKLSSLDMSDFTDFTRAIEESGLRFGMVFDPACKGIVLAASAAMAPSRSVHIPYAFNRKEEKDHGESGDIVGSPLAGRVLIVDDVFTAGTAIRESVEIIQANGAIPCGVAICLDRMERGPGTDNPLSAIQEIERDYGLPVTVIGTLDGLLEFLKRHADYQQHAAAVQAYRDRYGAT